MNRLFRRVLVAFVAVLVAGLTACRDEVGENLYFVGDSIIARWDLSGSFPSYLCHNDGRSGAGLEYVESLAGAFSGKNVVVMIGTNDSGTLMDADNREAYARQYVDAITALGATRTYLYSVLPRDFAYDSEGLNDDIAEFNNIVQELVKNVPSIVYINVFQDFMKEGHPNPQYYGDGLHLSPYGYEILAKSLTACL